MVLPLTERDQQGAVWGGLGSSKEMRLETQVEFQVPVPRQRAAQPQKALTPGLLMTINQPALLR